MERRDYDIKMMELIEFEIKEIVKKLTPLIEKRDRIESKINKLLVKKTFFNKLHEDHKEHARHEELLDIMERLELLKEPFRTAYQNGDSIDYQTNPNSKIGDHSYVEKYGYSPEMHSDCSYSAPGLHGFSLSSYGNWGTVYTRDLDDEGKEIFFNMIEENIIKPWRIRAYVKGDCFDYEDGDGWKTYDKELGWINCSSPYKK